MIPVKISAAQQANDQPCEILRDVRVLVADDSPAIRFVVATALRCKGAIVTEAANGLQAIDAALDEAFDIVLMDAQMPGLDGPEAMVKLCGIGYDKIPVIALTGGDASEQQACLDAGMQGVILKPFTATSLTTQVRQYLNKSRGIEPVPAPQPSGPGKPLFSTESLLQLCRGDNAFMQRMLGIAVQELPFAAGQMRAAFSDGNFAYLAKVVHRVRPCVEGLNVARLPATLVQIESHASDVQPGSYAFLDNLVMIAANEMERVARQIVRTN